MAAQTERGKVASYIPQLGKVDPMQFGIAVTLADGRVICGGDAETRFSIQSISKVFTLTLALGKIGDALWRRVGRETSGNPFNRSEEHTSELQSLMRISYAVVCVNTKKTLLLHL